MVERLAPKMKTQCVLISDLEALKKPVPKPIQMPIETDDPDNGDIEIDVDESPLRKTTHGDWPTMYRLPTFPPADTECLARKDPRLTGRERSGGKLALITRLFHQMTTYTWYVYSKYFLLNKRIHNYIAAEKLTPVEACVSADNIAGDTSRNVTAAMAQIEDVHQHLLGDVHTNVMAYASTTTYDVPRHHVAGSSGAIRTTEPGAINADYTPERTGLPNFASVGIATTGQRQTSGQGLVSPAATRWQDPQVYLAAAAAGKSSVTYHDIVDIVTTDTIDELIVAVVHDCSELVVKTGSKTQLESITLSQ